MGALPAGIEVCPVQLPGRENRLREQPFQQFAPLISTLAEALRPYLTVPYAFFGHSMGALVSFGLARQLRRQNDALPMHLFLSAYRAPQIRNAEPPLHQLPEAEFVGKVLSLNGTKREVLADDELRKFFLPILRADFAVCETFDYTIEAPLACPITVFGGLQDSRVPPHDLAAWKEQTSSHFTQRMLPGDHFFLQTMRTPLLQLISQDLTQHGAPAAMAAYWH
jgi:surfactin synthase thioesterase subunit